LGETTRYTYDANGNVLTETRRRTVNGSAVEETTGYVYDANGNALTETDSGQTTRYRYDALNKLIEVEKPGLTASYGYNADGIRTQKTENGLTTHYVVDGNRDYAQVLAEVTNGTAEVSYTYGDDLISQQLTGQAYYYLYDGHGSTRALADGAGSLTDGYDYDAFGVLLNSVGGTGNDYLYTGEQFDRELDQYYLRARYYDQGAGRFTQQDTWMGNSQDPITLQKYLYGNADPVNYIDPTGKFGLGSFSASSTISGILTTASVGSSVYSLYGSATDEDGLTAKEAGFAVLIAAAGPAGGKLIKLLGNTKAAKKLCDNVCNLLGKSKTIGPAIKFRNPSSISFTQSSIKRQFSGGGSLDDMIAKLRTGQIKSDSLPPIRIFKKDGKIFSLDNRRLYAAQQAGVKVKTVGATQDEILREAWKFTTKNGGSSIKVRGQ
ncbi:MAG: RHS repeat-associated core domain-containing protein, partial [Pseudomonadota bacterium]|nr:RHS repeat-associated core domain-containing protein [Pseudomonadota bacterium]